MTIALGLVSFLAWIALAVTAGMMAEERGQPPTLWFLVGLVLPLFAIVILAVFFDGRGFGDEGVDADGDLAAAATARRSHILETLAAQEDRSPHALAHAARVEEDEMVRRLMVLRQEGLIDRDGSGRWHLTAAGERALPSNESRPPAGHDR